MGAAVFSIEHRNREAQSGRNPALVEFVEHLAASSAMLHSPQIEKKTLIGKLLGQTPESCPDSGEHDLITLSTKLQIFSRAGKTLLFLPAGTDSDRKPIESLVRAVARAHDWYEQIISGRWAQPRSLLESSASVRPMCSATSPARHSHRRSWRRYWLVANGGTLR